MFMSSRRRIDQSPIQIDTYKIFHTIQEFIDNGEWSLYASGLNEEQNGIIKQLNDLCDALEEIKEWGNDKHYECEELESNITDKDDKIYFLEQKIEILEKECSDFEQSDSDKYNEIIKLKTYIDQLETKLYDQI